MQSPDTVNSSCFKPTNGIAGTSKPAKRQPHIQKGRKLGCWNWLNISDCIFRTLCRSSIRKLSRSACSEECFAKSLQSRKQYRCRGCTMLVGPFGMILTSIPFSGIWYNSESLCPPHESTYRTLFQEFTLQTLSRNTVSAHCMTSCFVNFPEVEQVTYRLE